MLERRGLDDVDGVRFLHLERLGSLAVVVSRSGGWVVAGTCRWVGGAWIDVEFGVASPLPNVKEWWGWIQVAGGDGASGGGRWSVLRAIIVAGDDGVTGEETSSEEQTFAGVDVGVIGLRCSASCVCDEVP
ncbi:hypothetical protein L2E82_49892 [Cichorium intybus]|uniref:Uncharacterized protein n=1 Tax=Cichorium intybus TaxID=13427 RepID=A0ACB8Z1M4_CICIN|nr:hypothetical protein L2E82_49892 [Cichorium intybus]